MIRLLKTNLLESDAEAWVNPVNCVGVMGAGIAAYLRNLFPAMFSVYLDDCRDQKVMIGEMNVYCQPMKKPQYIINFPTKVHWKNPSQKYFIMSGLEALLRSIKELQIKSIAIPALGCGKGGLLWSDVYPMIVAALGSLEDVDVQIYEPR